MALVSPGLQLTVTDESQYVPGAVGSVPLVLLATAQDKTNPSGAVAAGTTKANAGLLQAYTSQRELVNAFGYPTFQQSAAGTMLHGDERNEYGLMAAYSTLGVGNQVFALRADIDTAQLEPTSVRPVGTVANGTYWLDLATTDWGVYQWDRENGVFVKQTVEVINSTDTSRYQSVSDPLGNPVNKPVNSYGIPGSYAAVMSPNPVSGQGEFFNSVWNIFHKSSANQWNQIGTRAWQNDIPAVIGVNTNPTVAAGDVQISLNGTTIVIGPEDGDDWTVTQVATAINESEINGVTARVVNNQLQIIANVDATNGRVVIASVTSDGASALASLGITPGTYNSATTAYGNYVNIPAWRTGDDSFHGRPSGSIYFKLGATGGGSNYVIKKYNSGTDTWTAQAAGFYHSAIEATHALDPAGGGANIAAGTIYIRYNTDNFNLGTFKPYVRSATGRTKTVASNANPTFTSGDTFDIQVSVPGSATPVIASVTLTGTNKIAFVQDTQIALNAAGITNVVVDVEPNNCISLQHNDGGIILIYSTSGTPVEDAGFDDTTIPGVIANYIPDFALSTDYGYTLDHWVPLVYTPSATEPTQDPVDGTLWYYSNAVEVDIMINTGTGWSGYLNVENDSRGYDLTATDPTGVIVSASKPSTQISGSALASGDLWLDTSDLENYPALYRYTGASWVKIDNTDQVNPNGIVFGDARWDANGTTDTVSGNLPDIVDMLTSNHVDIDAPDYRLYPRGILLFNTRRSGYNVKRFVNNYFNTDTFAIDAFDNNESYASDAKVVFNNVVYANTSGGTINSGQGNPTVNVNDWSAISTSTWVSASGLKDNGSMYAGHEAQRIMVVKALKAAIDGNTAVREEQYAFNLIAAPGYPELIANMVSLNNDRANTAFIIGDTPMRLTPNVVDIVNWSNNTDNITGLTTNDPYLGVYYPGAAVTNDVSGNSVVVPPSHIALRTFLHNDNVSYQWFAPAGTRRGMVDNATSVGYIDPTTGEYNAIGVNQGLRDTLYENKINPITNLPGVGLVIWGQKTRNPVASAMDRINVARLVNYIRTILARVGDGFLFEPNDKITRDQLKNIISGAINDLVSKRGVYDYLVVCDESNNTPTRIARNELYVDIAIEPMKDVEFIYIPVRLYNPGDVAKLGA